MKEQKTTIESLKKEEQKQSYEKPQLSKVNLFADQVLNSCTPSFDNICNPTSKLS